ncbi:MAG: hypothetical protein AB8E82_06780 [Aureispira sp.]
MGDQLKKLKKLRKQVRKYEDTVRYYEKLFLEDGEISMWEQEQLDNLNQMLKKINTQIDCKEKELSQREAIKNTFNATKEIVFDELNTSDDVIDGSMIENVPVEKLKDGKIHGLKVTVHSAFWTEKLLDWVMEKPNISAEDLVKEILRINNKDYKDNDSYKHAIKNYECAGSLVSVKKGSGGFELTGYTNANGGAVVRFTIYMIAAKIVQVKIISPIKIPEKKQGMQQMTGVAGGAATFVMKYSGFGKLSRALTNYMEGKDPWTGAKGSTFDLAIGGVTDLLTMGLGGPQSAIANITLNVFQEALERIPAERLAELGLSQKHIGVGRETIDIILSLKEENGVIKGAEIVSNVIQEYYAVKDLNNNEDE